MAGESNGEQHQQQRGYMNVENRVPQFNRLSGGGEHTNSSQGNSVDLRCEINSSLRPETPPPSYPGTPRASTVPPKYNEHKLEGLNNSPQQYEISMRCSKIIHLKGIQTLCKLTHMVYSP